MRVLADALTVWYGGSLVSILVVIRAACAVLGIDGSEYALPGGPGPVAKRAQVPTCTRLALYVVGFADWTRGYMSNYDGNVA